MPARAAAAAGATLLGAVYWATSATGVTGGDSGELSISAWHWSVAHPPGYPLYTLVGWLWLWPAKLAGLEPAAWLAKLSVIAGAAAGYQLAMAVANGRRGAHAAMQGLAALTIFGLGAVWWSQCVVVEVYPLAQLLVVISYRVWCSSRRQPREAVPVQQRHLAGLALLASLGLGAHFALTIFAGVLGLSVWVRSREVLRLPRTYALVAVGILPGALVLSSMIWRAAATPEVSWAEIDSFQSWLLFLGRDGYWVGPDQHWPFAAFFSVPASAVGLSFPWLVVVVIACGWGLRIANRASRTAAAVETALFIAFPVLVLSSTRYFPSPFIAEAQAAFFFPIWPILGVWGAEAIAGLAGGAARLGLGLRLTPARAQLVAATATAGLALLLLTTGWQWTRSSDLAEHYVDAVGASAPRGAIVVSEFDNQTFPLQYAQNLRGFRPDLTVVDPYSQHGLGTVKGLWKRKGFGLTEEKLDLLRRRFPERPLFYTDRFWQPPRGWAAEPWGVLSRVRPVRRHGADPGGRPSLVDHPFVERTTSEREISGRHQDWTVAMYGVDGFLVYLRENDGALTATQARQLLHDASVRLEYQEAFARYLERTQPDADWPFVHEAIARSAGHTLEQHQTAQRILRQLLRESQEAEIRRRPADPGEPPLG